MCATASNVNKICLRVLNIFSQSDLASSFNQDGVNELILENSKNLGSTYFTSSFSRLGHRK